MKRKIIQISTCGVENTYSTQCYFMITALCDDGSVWVRNGDNPNHGWERLSGIPQEVAQKVYREPPPTTEYNGRNGNGYQPSKPFEGR